MPLWYHTGSCLSDISLDMPVTYKDQIPLIYILDIVIMRINMYCVYRKHDTFYMYQSLFYIFIYRHH